MRTGIIFAALAATAISSHSLAHARVLSWRPAPTDHAAWARLTRNTLTPTPLLATSPTATEEQVQQEGGENQQQQQQQARKQAQQAQKQAQQQQQKHPHQRQQREEGKHGPPVSFTVHVPHSDAAALERLSAQSVPKGSLQERWRTVERALAGSGADARKVVAWLVSAGVPREDIVVDLPAAAVRVSTRRAEAASRAFGGCGFVQLVPRGGDGGAKGTAASAASAASAAAGGARNAGGPGSAGGPGNAGGPGSAGGPGHAGNTAAVPMVRHTGTARIPDEIDGAVALVTGLSELWPEPEAVPVAAGASPFGGRGREGAVGGRGPFRSRRGAAAGGDAGDVLVAEGGLGSSSWTNFTGQAIPVTPGFAAKLYGIPTSLSDGGGPRSGLSVAGFHGNYSAPALERYQYLFGSASQHKVRGEPAPVPAGRAAGLNDSYPFRDPAVPLSSDLEMQVATGLAAGLDVWYWNVAPGGWVLEWAHEVLAAKATAPHTHVVAYSLSEEGACSDGSGFCGASGHANPHDYVQRANTALQALAGAGFTVIAAAGDDGNPGTGQFCPVALPGDSVCGAVEVTFKDKDSGPPIKCVYPSGAWRCPVIDHPDCNFALEQFFERLRDDGACRGKRTYVTGTGGGWDPTSMLTRAEPSKRGGVTMHAECPCSEAPVVTTTGSCQVRGYDYASQKEPVFAPSFPASSPHVVAVGATRLAAKPKDLDRCIRGLCREHAVTRSAHDAFTSGGGFSNLFEMPAWQRDHVNRYLASPSVSEGLPPSDTYKRSHRAFPDLAALGTDCLVIGPGGEPRSAQGTACAAAIVGAAFAILNDRVVGKGGSPLGNPNAWLYEMADASPETFNDVTEGDGCCSRDYCCRYCFKAAHGLWDPVAGLGTMNFAAWLDYIDGVGASAKGLPLSRPHDGSSPGVGQTAEVSETERVSIDDVTQYAKHYLIGVTVAALFLMAGSCAAVLYLAHQKKEYQALGTDSDGEDEG